ncbi:MULTISPECIES: nucleoside hydrolase [unclassified Novosphingobium]|uniref:nucleoside hydrolase n=1 Tax=unclassified Novosphingobium TaxID=2644732 RepID=UPI00146E4D71|nr:MULTISPECIES: nucleoside hydrolase [unclassified Novosphingobium]NMN04361.1 inosine-uridine nucleoside N-ribohydrolase [Novosphingobium sp. SG919]NMN85648.1 inosine-uridine nucleoside N-ribohydrolase [Novosphingobium sp. SG916]
MLRHIKLLAVAALLALSATAQAAPEKRPDARKVIIDDDGFGLMQVMLLSSPDVEVLGLTTVSGNAWENRVRAQALRGLEWIGRTDVPVVPGATFPLLNSEVLTERWEKDHGPLVFKGAFMKRWVEDTQQAPPPYHGPNDPVDLPGGNPTTHAVDEIAANFLIRMVHKYPGQITIVACGPMTNLALAQRLDPAFAGLARELVYMGGSLAPRQVIDNRAAADFAREFVNTPRREFNIRFDPEAASIMARAPWRKITMVPVDPSTATQLSPALIARLGKAARPGVDRFVTALEPGFPLWDEIAAAVWLDPALVATHCRLYIDFESQQGAGYGDTLSWDEAYHPGLGEQAQDVILAIDVPKLETMLARLVGK